MAQGIFIGIGGSGVKSLARLKAKIYEDYTDKKLFTKENSFIFIDTDRNDIGKIQSDPNLTRMYDGKPIIGLNEFIPIGGTIPFNVRQNAITANDKSGSHLKTWMILNGEGKYVPKQNQLTDGAAARRMDGRTAIFKYGESHIIPAIETAFKNMKAVDSDLEKLDTNDTANSHKAPNLWLISGSNGGTGSSMTLDILFIMNRLYYKEFKAEPIVRLALLTPQPYLDIPQNRGLTQYPLNSFSFMWELNAIKMNEDKAGLMSKLFVNHYFDNSDSHNIPPFKPYSYLLAFDTETTLGNSLVIDDTFENVAKVLFMLSRTPAGASINSDMSNYLGDNKEPFKPVNSGSILDNTEWSKSIVATGGKAIEKPNADLKNYLKTRFLYDIFAYGILGPELNEVHNDTEKAETVKNIINNNILLYLNNSIQVAEKPNLERDIISALSNVTMSPEPAKGTFGGYKEDGILSTYNNTFCNGIEEELNFFAQSFEKTGQLIYSKESYLNEIKETFRKTLNNLVCEYGLNYVKGLVYSIDFELEKSVLPNLDKTISEEYSLDLEVASKSEIDKISSNNKDYASWVIAAEKWKEFKLNKFIIQLKSKILISLSKEGYFDMLLSANGNSKGLAPLITKFNIQKNALETEYLNLAKSFLSKSNENPFVTYFPPLSEMIGGAGSQSGWKRNSEFENLYSSMVSLNKDEKNIKGVDMMGTPPVRSKKSGINSLEYHFEELLKSMGQYNGSYFIDFAEQNDFDRGAKSVISFMKDVEDYLNQKIIVTKDVTDWLKYDLGQVFKRFEEKNEDNKKLANSFKARFNNIQVFYPNISSVSSVYYIYNFPDELLELANSIGFEGGEDGKSTNPRKPRNSTPDANKLEVLAFETGHSFATYSYFKNYSNCYQEKRKEILSLDHGCHIHKGFVHLDLDRALGLIDKDIKPKLVEIAFYDAVLEKLSAEKPELFEILIKTNSGSSQGGYLDGLSGANSAKLPMVTITPTSNSTLIKILNLKKNESKKYELDANRMIDYNLENFECFSEFVRNSKSLNANIESLILNLRDAFNIKKDSIKGVVFDLIATNSNQWVDLSLMKLKAKENKFNGTLDMDFINNEFIPQINELISNNLFKN